MPPGIWILIALLGLCCFKHRHRLQKMIVVVSLLMIWVTSTPVFAGWLTHQLNGLMNWPQPIDVSRLSPHQHSSHDGGHPQAIVVLGGGRRKGALDVAEYQHQDVSKETVERLRLAVKLARKTHLPILVSGGAPDQTAKSDLPEATVMAWVLKNEYGLKAQWVENQSATTQENAAYSAKLLQSNGIQHIYLVTHFWHMPRAQRIFEKEGFQVTAAPHGYEAPDRLNPLDFYPNAIARTRQIWHEALGMIWYKLRYF